MAVMQKYFFCSSNTLFVNIILLILFSINLHISVLKFAKLIVNCMESNLNPAHIKNFKMVLSDTHHQQDVKYNKTAGIQWQNLFSLIKNFTPWQSSNFILEKKFNKILIKYLAKTQPLEANDLPSNVKTEEHIARVHILIH